MIRIVEEDTLLGTSKVTIMKNTESTVKETHVETHLHPNNGIKIEQNGAVINPITSELNDIIPPNEPSDEEILEACMEDTSLAEEIEEETIEPTPKAEAIHQEIYGDYVHSLNEQIDFLKGQVEEKNRQLNSKDELIRNFQYLLKEDRNRIELLEHKLEEEKTTFWQRLFKIGSKESIDNK